MSKSIRWEAMTPEQKDRLIHEKVMGEAVYCPGKVYIPRGGDGWYCPECVQSWYRSDIDHSETFTHFKRHIPHYTQSMDAAWLVLQKLAARYDEQAEYLVETCESFRDALFECSGDEIYPATRLLLGMAKWTPEHICKVALQAKGVEI